MKKLLCGIVLLLGWSAYGDQDTSRQETAKEEKPAMELGGLVTIDYGTTIEKDAQPSLSLGIVDLGAKVNLRDNVVASILIRAMEKLDSLWIDQAFVSYKPGDGDLEILFGQHTLQHGILTSRMISWPMIVNDSLEHYDAVNVKTPALTLNYALGKFVPGLAFTVLQGKPAADSSDRWLYSGAANVDFLPNDESLVRLSTLFNQDFIDIDLGVSLAFGNLMIDAEGYGRFDDYSTGAGSGYYAGIAYTLADRYTLALRHDADSPELFTSMSMRFAGAVVVDITDGIYAAAEFGHVMPSVGKAYQEVMVEIGLEQTIKLPGFQRKMLSTE
jgi:hypothetical protein